MSLQSFRSVKDKVQVFVKERSWGRFHTPRNVVLALAGECGELCEIFQWKGPMVGLEGFSESEAVHVGEEMADVFIYSTRLCDLCNIDLPRAVRIRLTESVANDKAHDAIYRSVNDDWDILDFNEMNSIMQSSSWTILHSNSPRDVSLCIQSELGKACHIFHSKTEEDCFPGLESWQIQHVNDLATSIASICILLACMARICNIPLAKCISEKVIKNELKYPVDLVQGSSAKYTAYQKTSSNSRRSHAVDLLIVSCVFSLGCLVGPVFLPWLNTNVIKFLHDRL